MNVKSVILVIDDEEAMRDACAQVLLKEGYDVLQAGDGTKGIGLVRDKKPDLVILDLKMPGLSGMEALEQITNIDPNIISVIITGYATISSAVDSMKRGAYDFLPKPFTPEELRIIIRRGLEKRRLVLESISLKEEKERMERNFISFVSHQLKSPLASIQQYIEAILSGAAGGTNPGQEKIFHRIKDRISGLLILINDWLNLSKISRGRIADNFTEVSLISILREAIGLLEEPAKKNDISLSADFPEQDCVIKGDKDVLREMFINLIDNGIKYNSGGGRVAVKVRRDRSQVVVEISDTGAGIPKEALPFIFDEFFRANNKKTSGTAGTGLGLTIVKRIIEAHSGFIKVESEPGKGSKFIVFLPV